MDNNELLGNFDEFSSVQKNFVENVKQKINNPNYKENYTIQNWDTLLWIANEHWLKWDYKKLILLNYIFWKEIKKRPWKREIYDIYPWENIFVPKKEKLDEINHIFESIEEIRDSIELTRTLTVLELKTNSNVWKKELKQIKSILNEENENIFPNKVESQWFDFLLSWFGNWSLLDDNNNPKTLNNDKVIPPNTKSELELVVCARLIRMLMRSWLNMNDLTPEQRKFFNDSNIDAWMMIDRLLKIWYSQKANLMDFFDDSKVWTSSPMKTEKMWEYYNKIIEIWGDLEKNWKVGTLLPLYFIWSGSLWAVQEYNIWREQKDKHYNTHMSMFIWNREKEFSANEIEKLTNRNDIKIPQQWVNLEKFLIMFINSRKDMFRNNTTKEMILRYANLINISVNWEQYEINEKNLTEINIMPTSKIIIKWPMLVDWLHLQNSKIAEQREQMNARSRFFFEYVINNNFFLSEVVEPEENKWPNLETNSLIWNLKNKYSYYLRKNEILEDKLKKVIEEQEKEKLEKLKETKEKEKFIQDEYARQIKWLKMLWFLKNENILNPWSFDVNRAIPYLDTSNMDAIYRNYVKTKSKEAKEKSEQETDLNLFKEYVSITTNPWDNYATLWNSMTKDVANFLTAESQNYKEQKLSSMDSFWDYLSIISVLLVNWGLDTKYPNLKKLKDLSNIQKRSLIKNILLSQISSFPKAKQEKLTEEFLKWHITEWFTFVLSFKKLEELIKNSMEISWIWEINEMQRSESDDLAIKLWAKWNQRLQRQLENTMYQETYTHNWWWGRLLKKTLWEQLPWDLVKSRWDWQIRLSLFSNNEEWITVEQLYEALHKLETKDFYDFVEKNPRMKKRIENDLIIVKNIKNNLFAYKTSRDEKVLNSIVRDLKKLITIDGHTSLWKIMWIQFPDELKEHLDLDDDYWNNIVWKIIWMSLAGDKLLLHTKKLDWILQAVWEEPTDQYKNWLKSYDNIVSMMYNLWEDKTVMIMWENYIIRILESLWIKNVNYPEVKTNKSNQLIYNRVTFTQHLETFINSINNETIKSKLRKLLDSSKNLNKLIYDLVKNPEIKKLLAENWKSTSLLPTDNEFIWEWVVTRQKLFRYVNSRSREKVSPSKTTPINNFSLPYLNETSRFVWWIMENIWVEIPWKLKN